MGGGAPIRDVTVTNSVFYGKGPQWGYSNLDNENLDLAGNIFRTTPTLAKWKRVRVTNNVFAPVPADDAVLIGLRLDAEDNVPSDYVFERNTYYAPNGKFPNHQFFVTPPSPQNCGYFWWNETVNGYGYCPTGQSWQQTLGYDTNGSTYITDAPAGPSIKVIDDPYDPFRRFVVVFNWTVPKAESIALDVSGFGWPRGVRYTLRNAADYYGDVQARHLRRRQDDPHPDDRPYGERAVRLRPAARREHVPRLRRVRARRLRQTRRMNEKRKICVASPPVPATAASRRRWPRFGASGPRAAAGRRRVGAARALRQRGEVHRDRKASRSPPASTWCSKARTPPRWRRPTGLGVLEMRPCSTTCGPTSS
jgi:hypothetical protein